MSGARPRLVDVADRAGVSTATASLVLRGRSGPSRAARDAVRRAAADLGYRPDRAASLLASRRADLLGVVLDVTSPFHAELAVALDEAAAAAGFGLVLATVTPGRDEAGAVETLLDFRCSGLVALGPRMRPGLLARVAERAATVVVGARLRESAARTIRADDKAALALAVGHLTDLGHTRIAYVHGPSGPIAAARVTGFRAAMRAAGCDDALIVAGGDTEAEGLAAVADLIAGAPRHWPTAVIAFNDRCAVGVRDGLSRAGIDVPGEMSVVGHDDSPLARLATVDLTSVSQDPAALAAASVDVLRRLLEGADAPADTVIAPRLVVRSSSGPHRQVATRRSSRGWPGGS